MIKRPTFRGAEDELGICGNAEGCAFIYVGFCLSLELRNHFLMAILGFDERGNLTPYEKVELDIRHCFEGFVEEFAESDTRQELYDNLVQYRLDLFEVVGVSAQWLNGSFVTLKTDPKDIDLVNLIPFDAGLDHTIERLLPYFTVGGSVEEYRIDAHLIPLYPEDDLRFENTKLRKAYFERWFGYDREGHPKDLLKLSSHDRTTQSRYHHP